MSRQTSAGTASVALLCQSFHISRAAYYAAKRAPAEDPKVVRLPARPRGTSSEVVLEAIRRVIAQEPAWGVRKVWARLARQEGLCVSRKRVWALMKANGLVLARESEPGEPVRGHVAVPEPNRRFATDLTTVWTKQDGVVAVMPTIDCGCRSILGLVVSKSQESAEVLSSLEQALEAAFSDPLNVPFGLEVRTDHGPQYTGGDCEALVTRWNLLHTYAPVGRPTGNAVVERVIRTMKEEVIWLKDWESAEELRAALLAWLVRYNQRRPHQALNWKTPSQYRAEKLGLPCEKAAA